MLGTSTVRHIADADDPELDAFDTGRIDVLEAFCGAPIKRGWFFAWGGSRRRNAPVCEDCAVAAGWELDPETGEWSPYDEHEEAIR